MGEIQVSREVVEAAQDAYERAQRALKGPHPMEAAIAAFCDAEGLTVEQRFRTYDAVLGASDPQQRVVGSWCDVEVLDV
jgi:hypothetical protein